MSYQLGIDLGTTYSAAAVCRSDGRVEVASLGGRASSVASVAFVGPDGSLVVGEAAQRRALTDPDRVVREFKRRVGDATPMVVGGVPVAAEVVAARFVRWMINEVAAREGGEASAVAVTHPAGWGPHKRALFEQALTAEGVEGVVFLSEPQAAAMGYANAERVAPGSVVGVYDLGGGTFDAAVARKLDSGGFEVLGRPEGIERLGGVDFDEAVYEHVSLALGAALQGMDTADPAVLAGVAALRRECTAAKEALSSDTEVTIPVMLPGLHTQVRLVRSEFEEMIRPSIEDTVEALRRAVASADVNGGELDAVLLVGGSSRIPLIAQLVSAELGRPVAVDADPKTTIATGAALAARGPEAATDPVADLPVRDDAAATALLAIDDEHEDESPARPSRQPGALRGDGEDSPLPARKARPRVLAIAAAASAAVVIGIVGTLVDFTDIGRAGSTQAADGGVTAAGAGPAGSDVAAPEGEIDPWTGQPRSDTTPPGPTRAAARPADSPPATRIATSGGSAGGGGTGGTGTGTGGTGTGGSSTDSGGRSTDGGGGETGGGETGGGEAPAEEPPAEDPPAEEPPAEEPPAEEPPAEDPPADETTDEEPRSDDGTGSGSDDPGSVSATSTSTTETAAS